MLLLEQMYRTTLYGTTVKLSRKMSRVEGGRGFVGARDIGHTQLGPKGQNTQPTTNLIAQLGLDQSIGEISPQNGTRPADTHRSQQMPRLTDPIRPVPGSKQSRLSAEI
jgi:hypothetical protein